MNPLLRKSGGQSLTKNDPSCVTLPNLSFNLKKASRPGLGLIWHPSQELTLLIHQKTDECIGSCIGSVLPGTPNPASILGPQESEAKCT